MYSRALIPTFSFFIPFLMTIHKSSDTFPFFAPKPWERFQNPGSSQPSLILLTPLSCIFEYKLPAKCSGQPVMDSSSVATKSFWSFLFSVLIFNYKYKIKNRLFKHKSCNRIKSNLITVLNKRKRSECYLFFIINGTFF